MIVYIKTFCIYGRQPGWLAILQCEIIFACKAPRRENSPLLEIVFSLLIQPIVCDDAEAGLLLVGLPTAFNDMTGWCDPSAPSKPLDLSDDSERLKKNYLNTK